MSLTFDADLPMDATSRDRERASRRFPMSDPPHDRGVDQRMLIGLAAAVALLVMLEPQYTATGVVAVIPRAPDPFQSPDAPLQDRLDERSLNRGRRLPVTRFGPPGRREPWP